MSDVGRNIECFLGEFGLTYYIDTFLVCCSGFESSEFNCSKKFSSSSSSSSSSPSSIWSQDDDSFESSS